MNTRTLALALTLAIVPAAAFAAPHSVTVQYADLDLATPQGQAKLDQRIDRAAKSVCNDHQVMTGTIRTTNVDQKCYHEALASLNEQMAALTGQKLQG